jgi:uncharacterized membrane protein
MALSATTGRDVIVGVFHDRNQAQHCVNDLRRAGFEEEQIGLAVRDGDVRVEGDPASPRIENLAAGATTGAVAGAGVGALWALGIAAGLLPAIGPVLAGGLLASVLATAAGVAAAGGLVGALVGLGIPEDEARYYEGEFHAGRVIVTVRAAGRIDEARAILSQFGAYDVHTGGGEQPPPVILHRAATATTGAANRPATDTPPP